MLLYDLITFVCHIQCITDLKSFVFYSDTGSQWYKNELTYYIMNYTWRLTRTQIRDNLRQAFDVSHTGSSHESVHCTANDVCDSVYQDVKLIFAVK